MVLPVVASSSLVLVGVGNGGEAGAPPCGTRTSGL